MHKRSKTRQIVDILASRGSLLVLGSITIWLGFSAAKATYHRHQAQAEIAKLKAEIIELDQRKNSLASLIDSFNDPETLALEAKKRLNLKKPGEEVAVILRDKNDESQNIVKKNDANAPITATSKESQEPSNPLKWWRYLTEN